MKSMTLEVLVHDTQEEHMFINSSDLICHISIQVYLFLLCFTLLCFEDTVLFFFNCCCCCFYKLKSCGNLVLNKSIGTLFPGAFGHFVSLHHILQGQFNIHRSTNVIHHINKLKKGKVKTICPYWFTSYNSV